MLPLMLTYFILLLLHIKSEEVTGISLPRKMTVAVVAKGRTTFIFKSQRPLAAVVTMTRGKEGTG